MTFQFEPCDYCGRFMKHIWYQATDEPDSWQDYWECSQQAKHAVDHPRDFFGGELELTDSEATA